MVYDPSQIAFKTSSSKVYDTNGNLLYELSFDNAVRNTPVEFSKFPKNCINAVVAVEDKTFWTNSGVDRNGTIRLGINFATFGHYGSGGSSIAQQVIKLSNLSIYERGPKDKFREIAHALKLDKEFSKEEILEMYLNNVYMGNLNYGFESASLDYFSKSVSDLSLSECAYLAGLVQLPSIYYPYGNFELGLKRKDTVLYLMYKNNFISKTEYDNAVVANLDITKKDFAIKAPHFVQFLQDEYGIKSEKKSNFLKSNENFDGSESLEIYTYYNYDLHKNLLEKLRSLVENNTRSNINNAASVVIDKDGNLVTMIGSVDFFNDEIQGKFNSSLGRRQPGTLYIPLVYKFALENGYSLNSNLENRNFFLEVGTGLDKNNETVEISNIDGFQSDFVSLEYALDKDLVIPATHILENHYKDFENYLRQKSLSGLPEYNSCNKIAVLEGCELTLLDLVYIYGGFSNINVIKSIGSNIDSLENLSTGDFLINSGVVRNKKDLVAILENENYIIGIWIGNTKGEELDYESADDIFTKTEDFTSL